MSGRRTLRATAASEERPPRGRIVRPRRHFATGTSRRNGAPRLHNSATGMAPGLTGRPQSAASGPLQGGAPGRSASSATILPPGGRPVPTAPAARAHIVKRPDELRHIFSTERTSLVAAPRWHFSGACPVLHQFVQLEHTKMRQTVPGLLTSRVCRCAGGSAPGPGCGTMPP